VGLDVTWLAKPADFERFRIIGVVGMKPNSLAALFTDLWFCGFTLVNRTFKDGVSPAFLWIILGPHLLTSFVDFNSMGQFIAQTFTNPDLLCIGSVINRISLRGAVLAKG
jgi:hypothetical protein